MAKSHISAAKVCFSITMHAIRGSRAKNINYLNEMWINQDHTRGHWRMSDIQGNILLPTGKGVRFIICHLCSAVTGFIPENT
jgi:hypothetical protein